MKKHEAAWCACRAHWVNGAAVEIHPDASSGPRQWHRPAGCIRLEGGDLATYLPEQEGTHFHTRPRPSCESCGGPALQDVEAGNMEANYCEAHRPCACGAVLLADGETFEDHGGGLMPGEPRKHARAECTDPMPGDDEEEPAACPECERSHGPHYSGPCEHGADIGDAIDHERTADGCRCGTPGCGGAK